MIVMLLALNAGIARGDLVAYWTFDEGSGTIAQDSSGNENHGTLLGAPAWIPGPEAIGGNALAFGPDNCAGVDCGFFDPTNGTGQFSITLWAFWDGSEVYQHFFTKSDGWGTETMMFQLELWGGSTSAPHNNQIGISYDPDSIPFLPMVANQWVHLAFVFDGAAMRVYLDGVDKTGPIYPLSNC